MKLNIKTKLEAGVGIEPAYPRLQVVSVSHSPSLPQDEGDVSAFPSANSAFVVDRKFKFV